MVGDDSDPKQAGGRSDDGEAFIPDPTRTGAPVSANDAEFLVEEYLASAITGEPLHMEALDEVAEGEDGGPFVELQDLEEEAEGRGEEEDEE